MEVFKVRKESKEDGVAALAELAPHSPSARPFFFGVAHPAKVSIARANSHCSSIATQPLWTLLPRGDPKAVPWVPLLGSRESDYRVDVDA